LTLDFPSWQVKTGADARVDAAAGRTRLRAGCGSEVGDASPRGATDSGIGVRLHRAARGAQTALHSLWHHPCRGLTAWVPQPCRQSCMSAASMQYEPAQGAAAGLAEFGFADGLEVRHAGGVRDGAVEPDTGPAAVELEGGEHVVEPG